MDPVANMLVIIKNGYLARKEQVTIPYSKFTLEIANVLAAQNFVGKVTKSEKRIEIDLAYNGPRPRLTEIKRVSKLGLRVYTKSKNIKKVKGGLGTLIISTPEGVMTSKDAKSKKLGGEVICRLW